MKVDAFEVGLCATETEMDDYLYVSPAFNIWQAKVQEKRLQSFGIFRKDTNSALCAANPCRAGACVGRSRDGSLRRAGASQKRSCRGA